MKPTLLLTLVLAAGGALATEPTIERRALLSARIEPAQPVSGVEVKTVTLPPHFASGPHLHPGPVVGLVTAGTITFQVEGEPVRMLRAGDAFHEPAGVRIARFDNDGECGATFAAFYLVAPGQKALIRLLPR